jgi:hypothetical protein
MAYGGNPMPDMLEKQSYLGRMIFLGSLHESKIQ